MGKSRIEYFTFGLIMSLVSVACFAQHSRITQLIAEKQAKMEKLEKCQGTTKKLKIAGISTLGVTAVGVGANIAEAVILKDKESKIATAKEELTKQQEQKEKREAEEKKKTECNSGTNTQYNEQAQQCECKDGYAKDENDNCVEKPKTDEKQDDQAGRDKQEDEESGEPIQKTQGNDQNSEAGTGSANNIAPSVSADEEKLPDWFEKACKKAFATINGTTCTRVDEPENEEDYTTQVAALTSEKGSWETYDYKFGLCVLNDDKYTCKFSDNKNNKIYILTVKVSTDKVKCSDGKKFNPTTRKCENDLSAPSSEPQRVEAPDPSKLKLASKSGTALTGQGNHNQQQSYCTKIGGTQSGNGCIYNKKIKIEKNLQESIKQILDKQNLSFAGFEPSQTEYIVQARTPDEKTHLQIKIKPSNVSCADTKSQFNSETGVCAKENTGTQAAQGVVNNTNTKKTLVDICGEKQGTFEGQTNDTNNCSFVRKDKASMKQLKEYIEKHSDAKCQEYDNDEAVICNQSPYSITITLKNSGI